MGEDDRSGASEDDTEDELIQSLLRQPRENLESRIRELEAEIKERQNLNELALSSIGAQKGRLEDHLHRLRYVSVFSDTFIVNREFMRQLLQLEENAIREMTDCFWDVSQLRQKRQLAQEELALERQRLGLMES